MNDQGWVCIGDGERDDTKADPSVEGGEVRTILSSSHPSFTNEALNACSFEVDKVNLLGRTCDSPALSVAVAKNLTPHLPPKCRLAKAWKLLYNVSQHGLSMTTMFRCCKGQRPCIVAIRDTEDHVFGAYISDPLEPSPSYYGSGECFLWRTEGHPDQGSPRVVKYGWSGLNRYFILCEPDYIAFGGGEGKYGLWIDAEFDRGISQACTTFNNRPLAGPQEEFHCLEFEVWGIEP